jgi:hypothetical protein
MKREGLIGLFGKADCRSGVEKLQKHPVINVENFSQPFVLAPQRIVPGISSRKPDPERNLSNMVMINQGSAHCTNNPSPLFM